MQESESKNEACLELTERGSQGAFDDSSHATSNKNKEQFVRARVHEEAKRPEKNQEENLKRERLKLPSIHQYILSQLPILHQSDPFIKSISKILLIRQFQDQTIRYHNNRISTIRDESGILIISLLVLWYNTTSGVIVCLQSHEYQIGSHRAQPSTDRSDGHVIYG